MKQCKRCDLPSITDICDYCHLTDEVLSMKNKLKYQRELKKIQSQKKKYHCLIGISGGKDSSILLYLAIKYWNLNPLVLHFDNGYNTGSADYNIELLRKELRFDFIRVYLNQDNYDQNCLDILKRQVPDCDIANDLAMAALMLKYADSFGIKYIFNGHNIQTEGSCPVDWTYMDAKYFNSLVQNPSFKALTVWQQLYYSAKGIKHFRPFYYISHETTEKIFNNLLKKGLKEYPVKHGENYYTAWIGNYYLPRMYGIDKTIIYKAAHKRNGLKFSQDDYVFTDFDKIPHEHQEVARINIEYFRGQNNRKLFDSYKSTFKNLKPLFWLLTKMGFFPVTFYKKYVK